MAAAGKYRSKKLLLASYVVFSYGLTGPILPLWFMKSAYIANLTARGKDAAYIDTLFAPIKQRQLCGQHAGNFDLRPCGRLLRPEDAEEAL